MANQSLTVSFSVQTSDDIGLTVDLDDEMNYAENNKRTSSFRFGDTVYFRVFTNPVDGVTVTCYESDGTLASHGTKDVEIEDTAVFSQPPEPYGSAAENTSSVSIPVKSGFVATGLPSGSPCGSISVDSEDASQLQASQAGPGVYRISYTANCYSFSINKDTVPPGFDVPDSEGNYESYPIVIVVVGV